MDDLRNYYHASWVRWSGPTPPPLGSHMRPVTSVSSRAIAPICATRQKVFLCWKGLGMGDHNAVDIAEEAHVNLLAARGGLMRREHMLMYPGLLPRNNELFWEGVVIDDRVGVQIYHDSKASEAQYGDYAFERSEKLYEQANLENTRGKRRGRLRRPLLFGAQVANRSGTVGPPRHKLGGVIRVAVRVRIRGLASLAILEVLAGQLAYVGCVRRPLLAALCHIFRQTSPDGSRSTIVKLHTWARNDLVILAFVHAFCSV